MKKLTFAVLFALLVSLEARACSCVPYMFKDHVAESESIYFATLQQAKLVPGTFGEKQPVIEGTFKVRRTLKGNAKTGTIQLSTPASGAACGVFMVVAETYVIFQRKGVQGIGACDGSGVVHPFQEEEVAEKVQAVLASRTKKLQKN